MIASAGTRRPETPEDLISPQLAAALDQLDIASARTFLGKLQGERRSKARGRSVEFEDFRQYVPGDDLRHIDWNVFARLDRFFIRIFQEEQDLALHIALDASPSMDAGNPNKLLFAQRLAMAFGYLGLVSNNRVLVTIFGRTGGGSSHLPPLRGRFNIPRLGQFLLDNTFPHSPVSRADATTSAANSFTGALRALAAARSGRGVMLILSDLLIPGGYEEGLRLVGMGEGSAWDVTLLQVLAPGELDPARELDSSGRRLVIGDLRLTDAETGRATEATVTGELIGRYRERFEHYQKKLGAFAAARGLSHLVVPSDTDIGTLLLTDMRRRGMLK